ncbi:MAG TPA: hypothetical protein PLB91_10765 [Spirochaetales bacterium]|nr:hypothetical protein [Spirochaetales bacterium]HRY54724.1 hypothetical protein [Spirochaetia bacterium]HRZ63827.1 hypothetical protein [Spirochaetia bacterium]
MAAANKSGLAENLAFAGALGVLALALVATGLFVDARRSAFEREALSALAKRPISGSSRQTGDPDFTRLYRIGGKGQALYGAVLSLRTSRGLALLASLFSTDGELQSIRLLGENLRSQPYSREGWAANFLGRGGPSPYPATRDETRQPEAVSGATESFLAQRELLERASAAVRQAAEARP